LEKLAEFALQFLFYFFSRNFPKHLLSGGKNSPKKKKKKLLPISLFLSLEIKIKKRIFWDFLFLDLENKLKKNHQISILSFKLVSQNIYFLKKC